MTKTDITFSEIRTFSADSEEESQSRTIRMNISGTLFQVQLSTLRRFPDSRLAKLSEDDTVLTKTVYFDQDATLFGHILRCCRSGEVHVPGMVCPREFLREMEFWGIPVKNIAPCCWPTFYKTDFILNILDKLTEVTSQTTPEEHRKSKDLTRVQNIWLFLDNPNYSNTAKVWYYFYLLVVGLSIVVYLFWMEPSLRVEPYLQHVEYDHNHSNEKISKMVETDPHIVLFSLDIFCILVFVIEFVLHFGTCPNKLTYFRKWHNTMNGILVCTMLISFVFEVRKDLIHTHNVGLAYYIMKNTYMCRLLLLLRLEKRYTGLKILILSVKESAKELFLLLFSLVMVTCVFGGLMFCAEIHTTQYPNIGVSLWWALVTISTIGYGDYYPTDLPGRIIGALCAVCGIIMLALPIAVISSRFSNFYSYRFYQKRHQLMCQKLIVNIH